MKIKSTWIPFFLSLVAIVSVRVYQIASVGVPSVRMQWDTLEMLCFWVAVIATFVIILMSYLSKDVPKVFVLKKSPLVGLSSIAAALVVVLSSVNELQLYISSGMEVQRLILGVVGILAGMAFIFFGLCFMQEKNLFEKFKLFACIPTFWAVMLLAKLFSAYNAVRTDFIHVTDVLSVIGLLFFLFEQARLFVGLFNESTIRKLFYFGFGSILFMMTFITNYFAKALDLGQKLGSSDMLLLATQLIMILYIVSFLFTVKVGQDAEFVEEISSGAPEKAAALVTPNEPADEAATTQDDSEMAEVDALIADIQNETAMTAQSDEA